MRGFIVLLQLKSYTNIKSIFNSAGRESPQNLGWLETYWKNFKILVNTKTMYFGRPHTQGYRIIQSKGIQAANTHKKLIAIFRTLFCEKLLTVPPPQCCNYHHHPLKVVVSNLWGAPPDKTRARVLSAGVMSIRKDLWGPGDKHSLWPDFRVQNQNKNRYYFTV